MEANEKLGPLRDRIDKIDDSLLSLIKKRNSAVEEVAAVKRDYNIPIFDADREWEIIDRVSSRVEDDMKADVSLLIRTIFALSKIRQRRALFTNEPPLLPPPRARKKDDVTCAFQGLPGAWSEHALAKLFPAAKRISGEYFEDIFIAVKNGTADYGVVAIENSQTGAIGETYDLLRKYGCFVVGRAWVEIKHCLMAPKGVKMSDIREVISHPEGFKQCRDFLRDKPWELVSCRNTAVAAKRAADSRTGKTAAIGSRLAAEHNELEILAKDISDSDKNKTSFVVIALEPEYDEDSDTVSISFSTAHRSGALCETLMPFLAQGINLERIESRPATGGNYRFFADLKGNILDTNVTRGLKCAAAACGYFEVIGCYKGE
ncbi:MAG: chorismate mutase [Clostridiales bacterium]|jgi:chorismate mutase/prephenate dehydratase|nr:chorismate mutase [Clostridiales bacterium]